MSDETRKELFEKFIKDLRYLVDGTDFKTMTDDTGHMLAKKLRYIIEQTFLIDKCVRLLLRSENQEDKDSAIISIENASENISNTSVDLLTHFDIEAF